jgi:hypothetical protein
MGDSPPRNRPTIAWVMWVILISAFILAVLRDPGGWFWPVLLATAFVYGWAQIPIQIHRKHSFPTDTAFEPFDPDDPQTVAAVARVTAALDSLGFVPIGHLRVAQPSPGFHCTVSLFENRPARDLARLLVLSTGERTEEILTFVTEYAAGPPYETCGSDMLRLTPPPPIRSGSMAFPGIGDAGRLYRAHRAGRGQGEPLEDPINGDPAAYLRAREERVYRHWVEAGHYTPDAEGHVLRLTWRGAIVMGWNWTAPVPSIRKALRRRRAARVLAKLDIQ